MSMDGPIHEKIQRVVDEYVGALGSAAIVSRRGELCFSSTHDDAAYALLPIVNRVKRERETIEPEVFALTVDEHSNGFAIALGDAHVLLVVTELGIGNVEAATRVKNAARLISIVLRTPSSAPPDHGTSGAPAQVAAHT
jgi:hypothetical protein